MVKLLQNQALNTTLARQHNLGYASSPKYLIFLYFNPSLQNSNGKFGLNLTCQNYLPAIHRGIHQYNGHPSSQYNSGFIGNRMIRAMAPSRGTVPDRKKTRTFKKINPDHQVSFIEPPIDVFLKNVEEFSGVINQLSELNLEKVRVKSLVGNIIKFKLGDALQIVHVHNQRHLIQAKNALKSFNIS